jgi:hypothetical protein
MPGIVTQAIASTVMPYALCSAFTESWAWPVRINGPFADGSLITNVQAENSRRSWTVQQKLTADQYAALDAFRSARKGPLEAFFFYPVLAGYDATGVSTVGRYLARFDGSMSYTQGIVRNPADFKIIQVQ